MYTLYGGGFTRTAMTEMVMAEGEIPYELREINIDEIEHRSPEFLAINPAGWVPALVTPDGVTIHEMTAINLYLIEQHDLTHLAPQPTDPHRGRFLSGCLYIADEIEPALKRYFYPHRYVFRDEDTPKMRAKSFSDVLERFLVLDEQLHKHGPYYLGDRFSLVDLMAAYWVQSSLQPEKFKTLQNLQRCIDLVTARPAIKEKFKNLRKAEELYAKR